jgi:alpha-1,3-mannosyltransferase
MRLYVRSGIPPFVLPFLILSKRLHSIYVLRLFNDCWATFISVVAINLFDVKMYALAAIAFSLAVSVKMNVLLYGPGAAVLFLQAIGFWNTLFLGVLAAVVQVAIAAPFWQVDALAYISRAFELSRVFLYKWTVNWRFISEQKFVSSEFALRLMILHVMWLVIILARDYYQGYSQRMSTRRIVMTLAKSQLVGILCARSLHYQFYCWFYWTVPFVLWNSWLAPLGPIIWAAQEYGWLVYPSTVSSSALVVASLALMVIS